MLQEAVIGPIPRLWGRWQAYPFIGAGRSRPAYKAWLRRCEAQGRLTPIRLGPGTVAYAEEEIRALVEGDPPEAA